MTFSGVFAADARHRILAFLSLGVIMWRTYAINRPIITANDMLFF